jgi:hypothetical protein
MPLASRAGCAWCVRLRGLKTNTHPFVWYTRALFRCFDFWKMNPTHHAHHAQTTKTLPFCTIICTFAAPLRTVAYVREHRENVLELLRTSWTTSPPWSKVFPMGCCYSEWSAQNDVGRTTSYALVKVLKAMGIPVRMVRRKGVAKPSQFLEGRALQAMNHLLAQHLNGTSLSQLEADHTAAISKLVRHRRENYRKFNYFLIIVHLETVQRIGNN